jgi:hypothetical protein
MQFRIQTFEFKELHLILGFLTNFKEGARNILLWLTDMLLIELSHFLLHVEILSDESAMRK